MTTGNRWKGRNESDFRVGMVHTDGTIKPFTYTIKEISPPDLIPDLRGNEEVPV
jgi:hypothetical protein